MGEVKSFQMVSKGQEGAFVDFFIFFMALVMGLLMVAYSFTSINQVNKHMDDLDTMSQTITYGDYLQKNYVSQASDIGLDLSMYRIGQDENRPVFSDNQVDNPDRVETSMKSLLESETSKVVKEYMNLAFRDIPCRGEAEFDVDAEEDSTSVQGKDGNHITCSGKRAESRFNLTEGSSTIRGATRYWEIIDITSSYFSKINGMGTVDGTGSDTSACHGRISRDVKERTNDAAKRDARESAERSYVGKASEKFVKAKEGVDKFKEIDLIGIRANAQRPPWDDASITGSGTSDCCRDFWVDGECCRESGMSNGSVVCEKDGRMGDEYSADAEYTMKEALVRITLKNENGQIITDSGTGYLVFRSKYNHVLDD